MRCLSSAGTDWRSENSASRYVERALAGPGPCRSSPPRTRGSASWRSRRGRRPAARRSRCPPLPRGRCRPSRPPPRRAARAATLWSASASCSLSGPFWWFSTAGCCRRSACCSRPPRAQRQRPRAERRHVAGTRMCVDVTCKDRSVKTSGFVCRPGRLRITSRLLMCFSERRARLRRRRASAGGARAWRRRRWSSRCCDGRAAGGRRAAGRTVHRAGCRSTDRPRATSRRSTGTRPRWGWCAASS